MTIDVPGISLGTASRPDLVRRRAREQRYRELVQMRSAITRLEIDRMSHGMYEDLKPLVDLREGCEEELERDFPSRWLRGRIEMYAAAAEWWHRGDLVERSYDWPFRNCDECERPLAGLSDIVAITMHAD